MAKKDKKIKEKSMADLTMVIWMPPPEKHPTLQQPDPIRGEKEKSIEITPWGPDWV